MNINCVATHHEAVLKLTAIWNLYVTYLRNYNTSCGEDEASKITTFDQLPEEWTPKDSALLSAMTSAVAHPVYLSRPFVLQSVIPVVRAAKGKSPKQKRADKKQNQLSEPVVVDTDDEEEQESDQESGNNNESNE